MGKINIEVQIWCSVTNERALYKAAMREMVSQGLPVLYVARTLRDGGDLDVAKCAQMLLDPGASPQGLQIEDSNANIISLFGDR